MRARLVLLGGQTIALGLMMAFLVVPVSAVFLSRYGADALAYVYLGVAGAGVAVSFGMARAQRRLSLASLAAAVLVAYLVAVAIGWGVLVGFDATWVTFPLLVMFPLTIPIGFLLVGSQAGRLLDVRQMKAHFPRVAAGFSVGFAVGGLLAAALVTPLGGPRHLLVVDVLAAAVMLALAVLTARRFPDELRAGPTPPVPVVARRPGREEAPAVSRWGLLANRMVALIFGYQLLSAAVTQLLDYLVWERAAARYPDAGDLARFQGIFGGIINVTSVVFVMLFAGWLLTRFGVGFGLAANPVGVLVLLVATVVAGYAAGPVGLVFFVLVCAQQVVDITLTDGTTRTSINATYQALLPDHRLRAQTMIEGAGVPIALGLVGVLLLVFDALDLGVRAVALVTVLLTVGWLGTSLLAYREYGVNLREVIARRAWDGVALRIDDDASRAAVAQLLASPDPEDVRTALDALIDAGHDVTPHVVELLGHPDPDRRLLAVEMAVASERVGVPEIRDALAGLLDDPERDVRLSAAAATVGLGGDGPRSDRSAWTTALAAGDEDRSSALRAAAAFPDPFFVPHLLDLALSATTSAEVVGALCAQDGESAPRLERLLADPSVPARTRELVVRFLGQRTTGETRAVLLHCLDDPDPAITQAASEALVALRSREPPADVDLGDRLTHVAGRQHRCLRILRHLQSHPDVEPLRQALLDEIEGAARRTEAFLGLVHDPAAISGAVSQLGARAERDRNSALEMIEVTVGRSLAPLVLALVDPAPDHELRARVLSQRAPVAERAPDEWLLELALDDEDYWRSPWLRACALHAIGSRLPQEAASLGARFLEDDDPDVAATARWLVS